MRISKIKITGLVQGVGFRPFVYRIASILCIKGTVENRNDGVIIEIEGSDELLETFINAIKTEAPPASFIDSIKVEYSEKTTGFDDFRIIKSTSISDSVTEISPDIAVCSDCLEDMKLQQHRINYPFINCTNCGPRFSIIRDLPYDREKTTMQPFEMCPVCKKEYTDILDRRFHAQPVVCNSCGPRYTMHVNGKEITEISEILSQASEILNKGKIIAVKGMGGYFIACNAKDETVVNRLRQSKKRDAKPFAVMFRDVETLKKHTELSVSEEELITSWRRPIVLLKQTKALAPAVNYQLKRIGAFLPYMPFHYQLFESSKLEALIMTSGNISDEPIIIDDAIALEKLTEIADATITYNREIYNRCDDSVAFVWNNKTQLIRRSRGFVPAQISLDFETDGIIACGAELKNTFCLGKKNKAIMSQHVGDLKNPETLDFYTESIERFKKLFRCKPELIVSDLHPDYLSTKYAQKSGIQHIKVQHHHAHIASCMAEHGINEKVIGVSLDGVGLGTDGAVWGGEFLVCDYLSFERVSHFDYVPMPGGDKASTEPWRMGISYLYKYYSEDMFKLDITLVKNLPAEKINFIIQAIQNNINTPQTSSCGRLFDAVAAISGICLNQDYEAQAAMLMESLIDESCTEYYPFDSENTISFEQTIYEIVKDLNHQIPKETIASKFHNTIAQCIVAKVSDIRKNTKLNKVVLSGGCFQNIYLLEQSVKLLSSNNFEVFVPEKVPANDGGIALGQLAIGAFMRKK